MTQLSTPHIKLIFGGVVSWLVVFERRAVSLSLPLPVAYEGNETEHMHRGTKRCEDKITALTEML